MKLRKITTITILLLVLIFSACQKINPSETTANQEVYQADLAKTLQADEYGMRLYVMAFLKRGPNRTEDPEAAAKLQRAHLDNIKRLAEMGKLSLAGPFLDDGDIRGIYIFNVKTVAEAEELTKTDPAIQAGSLVMELHPWYGAAALQEVNKWNKRVTKKGI